MTRHRCDTQIDIAGLTMSVEITFEFTPAFNGAADEPPHEAGAEIVSAKATGAGELSFPDWLVGHLNASLDLHDELVAYAVEQSQPDPDAAYDAARDASMAVRS